MDFRSKEAKVSDLPKEGWRTGEPNISTSGGDIGAGVSFLQRFLKSPTILESHVDHLAATDVKRSRAEVSSGPTPPRQSCDIPKKPCKGHAGPGSYGCVM